ncbi:MAG: glycosyltransferase family 2 protein [Caldisericia bacterium]
MATIDVLVPTYNRSAMLRRCLESIQAQTYTDIRVIVGDNCSDDDTRTVAQDFCGRDGRFGYVRNAANLGSIGNMNALFTRVTAPYVHFMHDDDWLEPSFYERMIAGLEESPEAGLVWPRFMVSKGENETVYGLPDGSSHDRVLPGATAFEELLHRDFIPFPAVVLHTSVLREVGPFAEYLTADWLMWLRIALHHDLKFIDSPLFHYSLHEGQDSADSFRMGRDVIDMFAFALGLEEFSGRKSEIVMARYRAVCGSMMVMAMKKEPQTARSIRELSSYFLKHVPDHHAAIRGAEVIALASAMIPLWLRPRKGGRLWNWLRHLLLS